MLIAGMVVLGIALDQTGLAASATEALIGSMQGMSPLLALIILYGVTLFATEILSNATVAVLFTPRRRRRSPKPSASARARSWSRS